MNTDSPLLKPAKLAITAILVAAILLSNSVNFPPNAGDVLFLLFVLLPALLFHFTIRSDRGTTIFGGALIGMFLVAWAAVVTSPGEMELRGVPVILADILAFVIVAIGAGVDERWRRHSTSSS